MAYDEDGVYGLDACVEDWEVKGWWERGGAGLDPEVGGGGDSCGDRGSFGIGEPP